jgi:hypothetical protein
MHAYRSNHFEYCLFTVMFKEWFIHVHISRPFIILNTSPETPMRIIIKVNPTSFVLLSRKIISPWSELLERIDNVSESHRRKYPKSNIIRIYLRVDNIHSRSRCKITVVSRTVPKS